MHSLVAVVGGFVAAVGSGVLLTRCFRAPRGDLIAWSVGLLGLLVSLGAQAMGYLSGFDPAMFRAMELGGQVIAPLAFIVALTEVSGQSTLGRFCVRLYTGALGIVALVVLALDQLTTARFSKAWPPPATFYQAPPNYLLTYAIGPLTALVAVISVLMVLFRSGRPGWSDAVQGQLLGAVAALALAYPGLAQLASHHVKFKIPLGSVFAVLCTLAAALAWWAAVRSASLPLAAMHGQAGGDGPVDGDRRLAATDRYSADRHDRARRYDRADQYDRADRYGGAGRSDGADRNDGADRYDRADQYGGAGRNDGADRYDRADQYDRPDRYNGADRYSRANGRAPDQGQDGGYSGDGYREPGEGGVYRGGGLYRPQRSGPDGGGDHRPDSQVPAGYADFATGDFLPSDFDTDGESAWDGADQAPRGGGWQSRAASDEPAGRAEHDRWHDGDQAGRQREARRHYDDPGSGSRDYR